MNAPFQFSDFAALSPCLILIAAALGILLAETFVPHIAKKMGGYFSIAGFSLALLAALSAPASDHPLVTPWLSFDSTSRFFTFLFLLIAIASSCLSASFFQRFEASKGEYHFLLISAVFGLLLVGAAADFLTLFLGLETLSIALYVMCGYMKRWESSSESAIKYFLTGAVASAFLLYGIALLYGAVGTTQLTSLLAQYQGLSGSSGRYLFLGGIAMITVGFAFKAALFPFHAWAPDVYDGAPTPVTAFMAVGAKAGAFAAFARVFLIALPQFNPVWNQAIAWLAIASMGYANIVALRQLQLRRFFAYSSISHAGFLLIPLIADHPLSLPSLEFYLVVYSAATLGAFSLLALLDHQSEGVCLTDLNGLFRRSPGVAALMTFFLLTLAGVPPTAGFFAKFYLLKGAFESGYAFLVVIALLTTIFSIFYYLRIVSIMFSGQSLGSNETAISWPASLVAVVSCVVIILLSLYPGGFAALFS